MTNYYFKCDVCNKKIYTEMRVLARMPTGWRWCSNGPMDIKVCDGCEPPPGFQKEHKFDTTYVEREE